MIIIPAILEGIRSLKDKTYKLVFETNELTPKQLSEVGTSIQHFGFLAFKKDEYVQEEKDMMASLDAEIKDTGKSKSQRLRGVLYRNWEQDSEGYKVFDDYYNHHMERMIMHWKNKL